MPGVLAWGFRVDGCKRNINCFGEILPGEGSRAEGDWLWDMLVKMELHCWEDRAQGRWDPSQQQGRGLMMLVEVQLRVTQHLTRHKHVCSLSGSSLPLGNGFSSLNLISMKHRQLFPRVLKGRQLSHYAESVIVFSGVWGR